jgi:predicted lipoprotein with Yx(FWY)xxD motif
MKRTMMNKRNIYLIILPLMTFALLVTASCKSANKSTTTTTTTAPTTSTPTTTHSVAALTVNVNTKTGIGTYLVDGNGRSLYWTTLDSVGQSNVTKSILANWPVFYSLNIVVPSSLNTSDFGSITRADGTMQTTYKGRPLYYYINDQTSGNTLGQGINGIWFAVDPTLSGPTPATTTSSVMTTTAVTTTSTTTTTAAATTPTTTTSTTTTTTATTTPTTTTSYPGY